MPDLTDCSATGSSSFEDSRKLGAGAALVASPNRDGTSTFTGDSTTLLPINSRFSSAASELRLLCALLQRPQAVGTGTGAKEQDCYSELGQGINAAAAGVRSHAERLQDLLHSLAV